MSPDTVPWLLRRSLFQPPAYRVHDLGGLVASGLAPSAISLPSAPLPTRLSNPVQLNTNFGLHPQGLLQTDRQASTVGP